MSRYEIADLEKELRMINSPQIEDESAMNNKEQDVMDPTQEFMHIPEFVQYRDQLTKFLPVRNGIFLRFFNRYKY